MIGISSMAESRMLSAGQDLTMISPKSELLSERPRWADQVILYRVRVGLRAMTFNFDARSSARCPVDQGDYPQRQKVKMKPLPDLDGGSICRSVSVVLVLDKTFHAVSNGLW